MRKIDCLVIHHSASAAGDVHTFRAQHKAKGWVDVGYHEIILLDGTIQRGRPHEKVGSGVWGANSGKLHVCCIGQFAKNAPGYTGPPTERQYAALGHWLKTNLGRYPGSRVSGHKEEAKPGHGTLCPGDMPLGLIRQWCRSDMAVGLSEWLKAHGAEMR